MHLVRLVGTALGAGTSMIGQGHYKRWKKGAGERLRTNETRYLNAYRIAGITYAYSPAQAVCSAVSNASIGPKKSAAYSTTRFRTSDAELYVPSAYLYRYLAWDRVSRYGSSWTHTLSATLRPCL